MTSETAHPSGWKRVKIDNHIDILPGYPFKSNLFDKDEGMPLIRIRDLSSNNTEVKYKGEFPKEYVVKNGDLLVGMDGDFVPSLWKGTEALLNQRVCKIYTSDKNYLNQKYLFYILFEELLSIHMKTGWTTVKHLSVKDVRNISLLLPPLPEQHKIASILSKVDEHISHTEAIIEKTEELKKGLMQQLLTKGIGHTKFKTFEFKGVKMQIPVEWDISSIEAHLIDYKSGAPLSPNDFSDSGCIVFPKKAVVRGGIFKIDSCEQTCAKDDFAQIYSKSIVNRSYLITTLRDLVPTGPNIGLIVKITDDKEYLLAQGVYGFRLKASLSENFLIQLSNSQFYRQIMNKIMVGSTQVHIRNSDFFNVKIPLPPLSEQQKIASILSKVDDQLSQNQTYLSHLQELKKGLMQDLLTGKVRVTV